jgi:plasmid stabilization system protein ParE
MALVIARDSPLRAHSFVGELRTKAREIAQNPLAFPLLDGFASQGVRRRGVQNYLIFYRTDQDVVIILRVFHGAREYEQILAERP